MSKKVKIVMLLAAFLAALVLAGYYFLPKKNSFETINLKTVEGQNFQTATDTDFSKADPNMPGNILEALKDRYNKAKEKLNEDAYDYNANMEKAFVLHEVKEYDKSEAVYIKMGELRPENYLSFRELGSVYNEIGDYANAEKAYLAAIKNNPHEAQSYLALAEIYRYHITGDQAKTDKFFQDGINALGESRYNLIQAYASWLEDIGKYQKALDQWKIFSAKFTDNKPVKDKIKELESRVKAK